MADCFVTRNLPGGVAARISEAGHAVEIWPETAPPPRNLLLERVAGADGLLCMLTDVVDAELLDAAPGLRVVSNMAVGCDNVDLEQCRRRGIPVGNTPGVLTDATADLAMALILAAARRLPEGIAAVRDGTWTTWDPEWLLGMELRGRTLGIIGAGRIGSAVGDRARAFGMDVIESGRPGGTNPGLPLADLLSRADIVSIHCPLSDATRGLVNTDFLAQMRPDALLVNTARGQIVDQEALAAALAGGAIAGAALDVTDPEPLPADDPLLAAPNLIVLPHLGSATGRTRAAMAEIAVDNLLAGLAGEALPHRIA